MRTRIGRTYRLARSALALLAKNGPEFQTDIRELAFPVTLDTHPVLRAAARRFVRTRSRDVVFCMARHDARFTSGASIQIYAHSPACLLYTSDAADERSSVDLGGRR